MPENLLTDAKIKSVKLPACPGVSRDMVRLVLRAMKSEGLIESTGKGRSAKWIKQA